MPADLSIGSPVDPTPDIVREALADAADAAGSVADLDGVSAWLSEAVCNALAMALGAEVNAIPATAERLLAVAP